MYFESAKPLPYSTPVQVQHFPTILGETSAQFNWWVWLKTTKVGNFKKFHYKIIILTCKNTES